MATTHVEADSSAGLLPDTDTVLGPVIVAVPSWRSILPFLKRYFTPLSEVAETFLERAMTFSKSTETSPTSMP